MIPEITISGINLTTKNNKLKNKKSKYYLLMYQLNPLLSTLTESMNDLVQDKEWQQLRQSLLGKWKNDPIRNCKILRSYLRNISECTEKKLRIVMNYLTGSGFRMGKIKHSCIQSLRNDISKELKRRKLG